MQYHDGMNLYEYVRSSPANRTDPSGLSSLAVSVIHDPRIRHLRIGTRINVKTPKCACTNVKWMQYLVYEKWVYMNPLTTELTTDVTGWALDGTPWYTKDISGPETSGSWQTWTLQDEPGTKWQNFLNTWEVVQDFETCAVCFTTSGKACTVACGAWGHDGMHTWAGTSRHLYGNGSQRLNPTARMLRGIEAHVGVVYEGMCPDW
jgi:hypothetical protein